MEKNRTLLVLISLIVIALLFRYSGFLGSLFAPEDDYVIFDDFSEGVIEFPNIIDDISTSTCACGCTRYATFWNDKYTILYSTYNWMCCMTQPHQRCLTTHFEDITQVIENGELNLIGTSCASCQNVYGQYSSYIPSIITINKDIKGIDFKFDLGFGKTGCSSCLPTTISYNLLLNDIVVYSYTFPSIANAVSRDMFMVETKSHLLDKNLIDVYVKGVYVNTFNITDEKINIKIKPVLSNPYDRLNIVNLYTYIDNIKFRVKFNCNISDNQKLVTEIYTSGEIIKMDNDQRISPDGCIVESWCRRHPAFIITSEGSTSDEGDEIYESMTRGEPLTVPAGETWQLFFITKKTSTGRCEGYIPQDTFEPVPISTVTASQTIYPGKFKIFETEHIDITSMPQVLKATFLIKAVGGGAEQTKDEVIVFRR